MHALCCSRAGPENRKEVTDYGLWGRGTSSDQCTLPDKTTPGGHGDLGAVLGTCCWLTLAWSRAQSETYWTWIICQAQQNHKAFLPPSEGSTGLLTCVRSQLCPVLCDPMDCSLPGSSIHGILQARTLEWVAISSSRGIFLTQRLNPHLLHWQADSLPLSHLGIGDCVKKHCLHLIEN